MQCNSSNVHNSKRKESPCFFFNEHVNKFRDIKKEIFYPSNSNGTHDNHCIVSGVFRLLDNLYHPDDTYFLLAVIRDSYKGDHLGASNAHNICHNQLFASWQIYKSMNDFTDFIVKVMKDFHNWDNIAEIDHNVRQNYVTFHCSDADTEEVKKEKKKRMDLVKHKLKRCSQHYSFFVTLTMAKHFGLFPVVQGCEWRVDTSMKFLNFNIFLWFLHLLKLRSCTLDGEVLSETPKDVFVRTVVKSFVTKFLRSCVDNKEHLSSLPHSYIDFIKEGCAEQVKQFYSILATTYLEETKMFYQPLGSEGHTNKHRKRKLRKQNINSGLHEKKMRPGKDGENNTQETDSASYDSTTQEATENCSSTSKAGDISYSSEDDHDFFVDPYDRQGETFSPEDAHSNNSECGGGIHNLGVTSFFSSVLQFLLKGLGSDLKGYVIIEHPYLNEAVNKLISGCNLSRMDVFNSIDFSMNAFVDINGQKHSKFTEMKFPIEQNVGEVITHMLTSYCKNICLLKTIQNNVETMPYIEIKPSMHGDLRSAVLFEVGNSNYNLQLQSGSIFFIVHINRMKCNKNNYTNFINTEAIALPVCDDSGAAHNVYGVLQSFIVTIGQYTPYRTFRLFSIIDFVHLTALLHSSLFFK